MNTDRKKQLIVAGIVIFISYISLCAIASKVGDHYFPMERFIQPDK